MVRTLPLVQAQTRMIFKGNLCKPGNLFFAHAFVFLPYVKPHAEAAPTMHLRASKRAAYGHTRLCKLDSRRTLNG